MNPLHAPVRDGPLMGQPGYSRPGYLAGTYPLDGSLRCCGVDVLLHPKGHRSQSRPRASSWSLPVWQPLGPWPLVSPWTDRAELPASDVKRWIRQGRVPTGRVVKCGTEWRMTDAGAYPAMGCPLTPPVAPRTLQRSERRAEGTADCPSVSPPGTSMLVRPPARPRAPGALVPCAARRTPRTALLLAAPPTRARPML